MPLAALFATAQQTQKLPVPFWTEDGSIPPGHEGLYVFITREEDALMVLLPATPESDIRGPKKVVRVSLHNQFSPTATFSIRELPHSESSFTFTSLSGPRRGTPPLNFPSPVQLQVEGKYLYEYEVSNDGAAAEKIGHWALVLVPDTAAKLRHVTDGKYPAWRGSWIASKSLAPWPQRELPGVPNGVFAPWSVQPASDRVDPGESLGGFSVQSDRKPGFTSAYFSVSTRDDEDVLDVEALPPEVSDQLGLLSHLHLNRRTTLTFGPMFLPDAPRAEIAANFRTGIGLWVEKQQLDPQSPFVKEVQQALQAEPVSEQEAVVIQSQPTNQWEKELIQALRISLGYQFPAAGP